MNINHKFGWPGFRNFEPSFEGIEDAFPWDMSPGSSYTFNFIFPISSDWNIENMHIVGLLIQSNGDINNGGGSTVNAALDNGWVNGIDDLDEIVSEFEVYPNPASTNVNINIDLKKNSNVSIQLVDVTGKLVRTADYGSLNGFYVLPLDISGLNSGLYMINFIVDNNLITQKLIIE